jgi:hypothetical protein
MAVTDSKLLTYIIGTDKEIGEYTKKYEKKHGYEPDLYLGYFFEGIIAGPLLLATCYPVGLAVEIDFFYRVINNIAKAKPDGRDSAGLAGKTRALYKKFKG